MNKQAGNIVLPCILNTYIDKLEDLDKYNFLTSKIDTVLLLSEVYTTPKMNLYWCMDANKVQ